jgi:hypothetical protein
MQNFTELGNKGRVRSSIIYHVERTHTKNESFMGNSKFVTGLVAGGIFLTACSSPPEPMSAADVSVSQISDAAKEMEVDELIRAWEDITGENCEASLTTTEEYGAQRVSCGTSGVLSTYDSASAIKQNLDIIDELNHELDFKGEWLAGANWTVNEDMELLEEFQDRLDGIIITLGH